MDCSGFQAFIYQGVFTEDVQRHIDGCKACCDLRKRLSSLDAKLQYRVRGSAGYHEYRKQLILQKVRYVQASAPDWTVHLIRAAYIFVLVAILFLPLSRLRKNPNAIPPAASISTVAFEVGKIDQSVQLRWKGDPRKTYRVYKGASPKQLQPIGEFRGSQWIDASRSSSSLVFYKIEAL